MLNSIERNEVTTIYSAIHSTVVPSSVKSIGNCSLLNIICKITFFVSKYLCRSTILDLTENIPA